MSSGRKSSGFSFDFLFSVKIIIRAPVSRKLEGVPSASCAKSCTRHPCCGLHFMLEEPEAQKGSLTCPESPGLPERPSHVDVRAEWISLQSLWLPQAVCKRGPAAPLLVTH